MNSAYAPDLKETFVIGLYDDNEYVNGWIDDVSMVRVYDLNTQEQRTLTFSEDVNGWTSFKSFIPENGLSVSKKYFTMKEGGLYQHYVPLKFDNSLWVGSTIDEAENYNRFYGITDFNEGAYSSIQAILNNDPSIIKTFNTLNYEGGQAQIIKPSAVEHITIDNAMAWSQNSDIDGWECVEIKTDVDTGSVIEFIKKEGKWFNYIKGKTVSATNIDTSRFSVQGLGKPFSVTEITI